MCAVIWHRHCSQRSDYPLTTKRCFEPRSERKRRGVYRVATWLLSDTDLFIRYGALDPLAELIALYVSGGMSTSTWVSSAQVENGSVEIMYTWKAPLLHTLHCYYGNYSCPLLVLFCFLFVLWFMFVKSTQAQESTLFYWNVVLILALAYFIFKQHWAVL